MKISGIIPARGGSKGVPHKNTRMLGGKPLVSHSIASAKKSDNLTSLIISTDDPEVIKIAADQEVDYLLRPPEIFSDNTPMADVVRHALDQSSGFWDAILILQPTCPFRRKDDIDKAIELMESQDGRISSCISLERSYLPMLCGNSKERASSLGGSTPRVGFTSRTFNKY